MERVGRALRPAGRQWVKKQCQEVGGGVPMAMDSGDSVQEIVKREAEDGDCKEKG